MIRLVQLTHPARGRGVGVVEEPRLHLLAGISSVYELAREAIDADKSIEKLVKSRGVEKDGLDYDPIYRGESEWTLLPPFDRPADNARCFVTGTGLTHKASAQNRPSMQTVAAATPVAKRSREAPDPAPKVTDSMKMYQIGLQEGRPKPGHIGAAPEWFYKGVGTILRAHGQPLDVPNHADDGGDEAEIAGCYLISEDGTPFRVGLAQGNEFCDHVLRAKNSLYVAQSKLSTCSIGPEIVIGSDLSEEVRGHASVGLDGKTIWAGPLASGEPWMCHSLANLEHHHFKHAEHCHPGDAHIHYFGADLISFKDGLRLEDGDVMMVSFIGFGRALRNPARIDASKPKLVKVTPL